MVVYIPTIRKLLMFPCGRTGRGRLESKGSSPDSSHRSLLSVGVVFWDASTHGKWWRLLGSTASSWVIRLGVVLLGGVAAVTMPVLTQAASINSPDHQAGHAWSPFFALSNPALSVVNTHFLPPQQKPQNTIPGSSVPESC